MCRSDGAGEFIVEAGCLDAALSRRAFARAWKRGVDAETELIISERVGRGAVRDEHPDAH